MARGESKPYKTGDGRWRQALTIPGQPGRKYFSARTEREVRAKVKEAKARLARGLPATPARQTLGQYLEAWLEDTVSLHVKPHTLHSYQSRVRHVSEKIGHLRLEDVTPDDIRRCYRELKEERKPNSSAPRFSARTVNAIHVVLKNALKTAVLDRVLLWNPMDAVAAPKWEESKRTTLSLGDARRLIDHTADDRLGALWHTLLTTGIRIGEAMALRWSDLDLEAGTATIDRTMQRVPGGGVRPGEPKTKTSKRVVYLDPDLCQALRGHRQRQRIFRLAATEWHDSDLVFCGRHGQPLDSATCADTLHRALRELSLPSMRVHDLRHSYATIQLYELGVALGTVQLNMGHSNIGTTAGTYGHPSVELRQESARRMGEALREVRKKA